LVPLMVPSSGPPLASLPPPLHRRYLAGSVNGIAAWHTGSFEERGRAVIVATHRHGVERQSRSPL
jgi:hypothetical protein